MAADETERRLALNERTNEAIDSVVQKLFSSKKSKADEMKETKEFLKSLGDLLDVYNPTRLAAVWNRTQDLHLTEQCFRQMQSYLKELGDGAIWALKMSDASGKYGGGFLWGNNYWVGSATLCYQINEQPVVEERAPFALGFFMLRTMVKLNSHITPTPRSQLLGVCLPLSCTSVDASRLVELSAREAMLDMDRTLQITSVKSPHNAYYITDDPIFWILVVVSTAVFVLLLIGTVLDLYLEYVMDKDGNFSYDNYTFVFSKNIHHNSIRSGQTVVKVEMNAENNNNGVMAEDGSGVTTESNSVASDEVIKKPGVLREVMLSFSVRRNMMTICDKSVGADTIPTVHGLRSLSMAWVILGHTCIVAFKYSDNMMYRNVVEKELLFQTINNAAFSVDTFFFISGLLVAFLYFRTTAKHDLSKITKSTGFVSCVLQFIGMVAYRFARSEDCGHDDKKKQKYEVLVLLFNSMCMLWSWYLADDTQFYVLGTILLIMAVKHFRAAASLMVVFLISSWCTTAYIAFSNKHMPNVDDPLALFDKIYDKPWTRFGPYLVGMATGWFLFKIDCKIKMNRIVTWVGWTLSTVGLLCLLYGLYEQQLHPVSAAAYSSLSHTAWATCLAWIVIACSTGYGGYVNKFLSWTVLYPFSRVTYCAYLIHPIIIRIFAMRMDSPVHLGKDLVAVMFLGQLVASYILSFIVSLAFEAPVVSLLRIVSSTKRKTK
ncbi:nose resistant to fluoxetine protein 6 [Nilaparvata lugens]|uniref:nose resistant to fluoxetine protein 6 n=1 Tax=Nilaparvata lugens TaxID=108931 RepID=UPI00193D8C53|nr:nose resistant to fluoxetine protein 6 [Nilaparvata lugens]